MGKFTAAIDKFEQLHRAAQLELHDALKHLKKAEAFRRKHSPTSQMGKHYLENAQRQHKAAEAREKIVREKLRSIYSMRADHIASEAAGKETAILKRKVARLDRNEEVERAANAPGTPFDHLLGFTESGE